MKLRRTSAVWDGNGQPVIVTTLTSKLTPMCVAVLYRLDGAELTDRLKRDLGWGTRTAGKVLSNLARMGLIEWGWDLGELPMVRPTDNGRAVAELVREKYVPLSSVVGQGVGR